MFGHKSLGVAGHTSFTKGPSSCSVPRKLSCQSFLLDLSGRNNRDVAVRHRNVLKDGKSAR